MGWPERGAFVLVRGCARAIWVLAVVPKFVLVAQVIRVRWILWAMVALIVAIVRRFIQMEDRLVLVVVDHHPADNTVHFGPRNALYHLLFAYVCRRGGIKANRRGG